MTGTDRGSLVMLLDSSGIGGIETHIEHLAPALARRGRRIRVWFLADHGPHPLRDRLARSGVPWRCLAGGPASLYAALRASRPGLLHTHGYKAGILGRLVARATGTPVASTFHAGEPGRGRLRAYQCLDRLTAPLAHLLIAVSANVAAALPSRTIVVPNFVPVPASPSVGGEDVAFVGRLSHEKGADLYLAAAREFPGTRFHVFGDGPERAALEARATPNVHFHGFVDDLGRRWPGIALLCLPSRHEGLPLAALEAMAHAVPVLASRVGGLPELIDDGRNGLLVAPDAPAALIGGLHCWHAMPRQQRDALSAAAHGTVRRRYGEEVIVPQLLALFDRHAVGQRAGAEPNPEEISHAP